MSLHDLFVRLATIDDDDTAHVLAIALNADMSIRRITKGVPPTWEAHDVKRVARTLADHAGVSALGARTAAQAAIATAVETELPFNQEEPA